MCISPSAVWVQKGPDYEQVSVPCKKCWSCRENRVNDWVGRCMAEAAYSNFTTTVTLTYRDTPEGGFRPEKVIYPPHFQKFVRALRKRGHKVRYLAVGEYGTLKGRAHFHAILFFQTGCPRIETPSNPQPWPHGENFHHDAIWPHGHMYAEHGMSEKAIRYVVKYLLKNTKDKDAKYWLSMSKKPALGAAFFRDKAKQHAKLGALPTGYHYSPPGVDRSKRKFFMTGATRRDFLLTLVGELRERGSKRMNEFTWLRSGGHRVSEFIEPGLYKVQRDRNIKIAEEHMKGMSSREREEALEALAEEYASQQSSSLTARVWSEQQWEEYERSLPDALQKQGLTTPKE
jgi:hypothetical protein